jgi:hypothetical protein
MDRFEIGTWVCCLLVVLGGFHPSQAATGSRCGPDRFDILKTGYDVHSASVTLVLRLDRCYPDSRFWADGTIQRDALVDDGEVSKSRTCRTNRKCRLTLLLDHPNVEKADYTGVFKFSGRGAARNVSGSINFELRCLSLGIETRCHLPIP